MFPLQNLNNKENKDQRPLVKKTFHLNEIDYILYPRLKDPRIPDLKIDFLYLLVRSLNSVYLILIYPFSLLKHINIIVHLALFSK